MATDVTTAPVSWTDGTILTEVFKTVDDHQIKADIILPLGLKPGKHPLIIAYHGGALVAGSRNYPMFMAAWLPPYALSHNAIILSPDHRLLPSCTSSDIVSDLESLWSWALSSLPSILSSRAPGYEVDLSRILVEGGSAGGFCAAHLALSHPEQVKAAILVYPMVDMYSEYFRAGPRPEAYGKGPPGMEDLKWRGEELREKIKEAQAKGWVSERVTPMGEKSLGTSILQGAVYGEFFERKDDPVCRVREGQAKGLPGRVWILHGKEDTLVPAEGSRVFIEEVKKVGWKTEVMYDEISDEPSEHGFDATWTVGDEKLKKRLDWISEVF